jgi:branched-chain amino acid aminotransferase
MEIIPYDKRSGKIWFNGESVDWSKAQVHLLSHGLHYASCVFEGIRVYEGEIFKLAEHTKRLFHSAKRMGMDVPYSEEEINKSTKQIVSTQKTQNGYVK